MSVNLSGRAESAGPQGIKGIVVSLDVRSCTPPCGLLEKEPEAEKGGVRGSRRRRAWDAMHHGTSSSRALPCRGRRAPRGRTRLPYPIGHARGGRGTWPGPRTNQIEGKKLPAFKILLLRHHPPPCGEQVVSGTRVARTAGRADGRAGRESGQLGSEAATPT